MPDIIEPRVLKGFRDYLPEAEQARNSLLSRLEPVFRSFGFVPIDTPALEYAEILLGKGGGETDKQVYRFTDNGGRDVALRFDLTVPFARFMAEHVEELYLPFRRYHMAKVWRGENTQRGRYREFMQCDFDIVGTDSASADADIILVIAQAIRALEAGKARIRVNHRALFNRFLARAGCLDKSVSILRSVDKIEKIGREKTRALIAADAGESIADEVLSFIEPDKDFLSTLEKMSSFCANDDVEANGAKQRLKDVYEIVLSAGDAESLYLDPSITRGLDYYTGVVFETFLTDLPSIGSVCSGGRYNELASLYTNRSLPGVGASVGLDRLLSAMEILERPLRRDPLPQVLIANLGERPESELHSAASELRSRGISCEVYPEAKKLLNQYSFAQKKSIPFALLMDRASAEKKLFPLRNLEERRTMEFGSLGELADFIKAAKA
jgi:histidyl-tRNA synthetase